LAWHSVEDSSGKSGMVLSIGMPTVIDVNGKKETIYALREFTRE